MVITGLRNEATGVVEKVQAAGTVYNEELNSLALGKDTVASGQDQFVFGRYNEEDADKAEIVGGGVRGDSREITDSSEILSCLTGLAIGSQVTITPNAWTGGGSMKVLKAGNSISEAIAYIKSLFEDSPFSTYTIVSGGQYSEEDVCSVFALLNIREEYSGHGLWAVSDAFVSGVLFLTNNGEILKCTHSESSKYWTKASGFFATTPTKVTTVESITPANIRTLDWQGNQWNKGDVTCDDGNGETVSMRGLAAHKANVYETENIEALDGTVIEKLKAGDIIIKKGENSNHAYRVSFKNATGMCLTYADAENVETIAYDKTDDTWAKTDKTVTGITGKADANHNHDTAYAALNHNHDDVYAAKTHTHNIADVTGLQLALNGKMGNLLSLNMSADTGNSTFLIDSTESGVLDRYAHGLNADEWHPVCVNLFEDEVAVGQVFGFAKVTFGTNSATIVVVIGNKKFSTASTSFSSDTYTFEAWTKASVGQSFFA